MNDALRAQLRLDALRLLDAAGRIGYRVESLLLELRAAGYSCLAIEPVADALLYLSDKGYIEVSPGVAGPSTNTWRITAAGADACENLRRSA